MSSSFIGLGRYIGTAPAANHVYVSFWIFIETFLSMDIMQCVALLYYGQERERGMGGEIMTTG
jgi:hypothetical protein